MEKNIKNGILATVVGGLILAAILGLIAFFTDNLQPILSTIWSVIESIIIALMASYTLPIWQLLIIVVLALISIAQLIFSIYKKIQPETKNPLEDYKEQSVDEIMWRFKWIDQKLVDLTPHCPMCNLEVHASEGSTNEVIPQDYLYFYCESCDRTIKKYNDQWDIGYPRDRAKREIERIANGIIKATEI